MALSTSGGPNISIAIKTPLYLHDLISKKKFIKTLKFFKFLLTIFKVSLKKTFNIN